MSTKMKPLEAFSADERRAIRVVLFDIDDTLTTAGKLTAEAYGAMSDMQMIGLKLVPITGRPAGWCDHIARMWPVDGVVGENGAFYYRYDQANRRMIQLYADDAETRAENRITLDALGGQILETVPGTAIASDQFCRAADLAIDFCEDVPALPMSEVDRIVNIFKNAGANAKISSIHVNGWFGEYDKLTMAKRFLTDQLSVDPDQDNTRIVFAGDSPNDAPMFEFFNNSVGVANVIDIRARLESEPKYVTESYSGAGFTELAHALIDVR